MDLIQRKLSLSEWNSIEVRSTLDELNVLLLIQKGYTDPQYVVNHTPSIHTVVKMAYTDPIEQYIFQKYFVAPISKLEDGVAWSPRVSFKLKKADLIRLETVDKQINHEMKEQIFEFILLKICQEIVASKTAVDTHTAYYALNHMFKLSVHQPNRYVLGFVRKVLEKYVPCEFEPIILNAHRVIEQNKYVFKYQDHKLYDHQKQLFTLMKHQEPQLILYSAPTGTGKTLSPIGLSEQYKIIFICAARHVGLALAKAAISIDKKIAFAFGCSDASDIRLHYYAAKEYTKDKRSGTIRKVDNTVGDKVEIMICDIKSYLPAMRYMLAFNKAEEVVLYWDEPTITLDYETHPLHSIIHENWVQNEIPKVVLSSATLPAQEYIATTVADFKMKFQDASVHSIQTFDCKKSICVLDSKNNIVLPHYYCETHAKLRDTVVFIQTNKTLLRYFDVSAIVHLIEHLLKHRYIPPGLNPSEYFETIDAVTITTIKLYYLELLRRISKDVWPDVYAYESARTPVFPSSIQVTMGDAWTLTDGPTIYLTNNVKMIATFCLQQANIPTYLVGEIMKALEFNNVVLKRIDEMTKEVDFKNKEDMDKDHDRKMQSDERAKPEVRKLRNEIDQLRAVIKSVSLHDMFIPNTKDHLDRFKKASMLGTSYTSSIDSNTVEKILMIDDVEDSWKILLMMGIGVFASHNSARYIELMKELASKQQLYVIIADTDYIYGTNYQFCHAYLGKDLEMTQEKMIQAMGRVGRGKLQQTYSIRLRSDAMIQKLFTPQERRIEVDNMSLLFTS